MMEEFISAFKRTFKGTRKLNERRKYQGCGIILALVHLIMTILFEQQELSMSIASGLLGYLGGVKIAGRRP